MDTNIMSVKSDGKTRISKANTELNSKLVAMRLSWVKTTILTWQIPEGRRRRGPRLNDWRPSCAITETGQPVNYLRGIAHNLRF